MEHRPSKVKLYKIRRWAAIGFCLLAFALVIPARALAGPPSPLLPGSENARQISDLFYIVLAIAVVVFLFVEALLLFAVLRYRRREDDEEPEQIHGNATLEIMWTVVPTAIMVVLFTLTIRTVQAQREVPDNAMQIRVTGSQWFWTFQHPTCTGTDSNVTPTEGKELHVPVGTPIELVITSTDVIHSFWVPQLGGKQDAVPGHNTVTWFEATEAGTYPGQCAEFCGLSHYAMLFDVVAVSQDEYDAWYADKCDEDVVGPPPDEILPGNASAGEQVFEGAGCAACHSLDGTPLVGPSLQGISQRAGGRVEGLTAEHYISHSVLEPCEFVVSGFQCVMPDFSDRFPETQFFDLIAFLMQQ